jgi:hypothetical protein
MQFKVDLNNEITSKFFVHENKNGNRFDAMLSRLETRNE